jgi:uncharacterized protein (DUF433 family)
MRTPTSLPTAVWYPWAMRDSFPDYLTLDPDGLVRVTGHRIGLHHVVRTYNDGYSAEMLLGEYPTLSLSLIHKLIAFYLDHREDVDAYAAEQQSGMDAAMTGREPAPAMAELRRRMARVQREAS